VDKTFCDEFLEVDAHDAVVIEEAGDEAIIVDVYEARPDGCGFRRCRWTGEAGNGTVAEGPGECGGPVLECSVDCLSIFDYLFQGYNVNRLAQTGCYFC